MDVIHASVSLFVVAFVKEMSACDNQEQAANGDQTPSHVHLGIDVEMESVPEGHKPAVVLIVGLPEVFARMTDV